MENIINVNRKNIFLLARKEINTIVFNKFKPKEIDLFYLYLLALKENNCKKVTISFEEIKRVIDIKRRNAKTISNLVEKTNKSFKSLVFKNQFVDSNKKKQVELISIFKTIKINESDKLVTIPLDNDFKSILTNTENGNFIKIDLIELISLKLVNSKKLYLVLKEQNNIGLVYLRKIENWKDLLGLSKNYLFKHINKQILIPAINELKKYFNDLEIITKSKGNKITHFGFKFTPNKSNYNKQIIDNKKNNHKVDFGENSNDYCKNIDYKPMSKEEIQKKLWEIDNY